MDRAAARRPARGEVASDVVLARSEGADVSIAYLDAYPEGLSWRSRRAPPSRGTSFPRGRWFWPGRLRSALADGRRAQRCDPSTAPEGRRAVADGRAVTNIGGHDRPAEGPVMWPLRWGGREVGQSRFDQGYWISPLPSSGPVASCASGRPRDPVGPLRDRRAVDGRRRGAGASDLSQRQRVRRDDREWRLGTDADVTWIDDGDVPRPGHHRRDPADLRLVLHPALPQRTRNAS